MAKYGLPVIVGAILLAAGIVAFAVGSIPSYSITFSYLSFSEINVGTIIDAEHVYYSTLAAEAKDKFVLDLATNNRPVNLTLFFKSNVVYTENFIDEIDSEFLAPSAGVYDLTLNATESVAVNGTISVLRLTATATATAFYVGLGLGLTIFSLLFISYGVFLYFESAQTVRHQTLAAQLEKERAIREELVAPAVKLCSLTLSAC